MATEFTKEQIKDLKVLVDFVELYCRSKHNVEKGPVEGLPDELSRCFSKLILLCDECSCIVLHGIQKRMQCPLDPKPSCKKCHIHCYSKEYRDRIREIMAFSGKRMILRGRLDYLRHYL